MFNQLKRACLITLMLIPALMQGSATKSKDGRNQKDFKSAAAIDLSQVSVQSSLTIENLSTDEKKLYDIVQEIRVIQHSCNHTGKREYLVPRRCQGSSLLELQNRQEKLISKALSGKITNFERLKKIIELAEESANYEVEKTLNRYGLGIFFD